MRSHTFARQLHLKVTVPSSGVHNNFIANMLQKSIFSVDNYINQNRSKLYFCTTATKYVEKNMMDIIV